MKLTDTFDAIRLYDDHVRTLDEQERMIADLKAQLAAANKRADRAQNSYQFYYALYLEYLNIAKGHRQP